MEVFKAPNPKLRIKTKPVKKITPDLAKIVKEMVKLTSSFKDPEGVGLASTQIGREERFFVMKAGKTFIPCFNPKILSASSKTKTFFEGCLSIPDYYGYIKRPISVTVSYQDEAGKTVRKKLTGLQAWIFQHEMDHLEGKLFLDHVLKQRGKIFKSAGKDKAGSEIFQEIAL